MITFITYLHFLITMPTTMAITSTTNGFMLYTVFLIHLIFILYNLIAYKLLGNCLRIIKTYSVFTKTVYKTKPSIITIEGFVLYIYFFVYKVIGSITI